MSMPTMSFDDLEVGAVFQSRGRTLGEGDLSQFSALTWDVHPLHTDAEWAAGHPFGSRVAHGVLVLSYSVGLIGFDYRWVVALRRFGDVSFKRPLRIGDTMSVRSEILELREVDDEVGLVVARLRVVDQEDRLSVVGTIHVLWRRGRNGVAEPA